MDDVETRRQTLTIKEAAARLGISKNSCYTLAQRGELPGAIRLGGRIVVSIYQFERFLHGENNGNKGNNI